jgi:O-antigen/teichoic acid export membrane protein
MNAGCPQRNAPHRVHSFLGNTCLFLRTFRVIRAPEPAGQSPDSEVSDAPAVAPPLRPIVQVFLLDVFSKALWALAGMTLIRVLSPTEYAGMTLATAAATMIVAGLTANLNKVYIVGFERLDLQQNPQAMLGLQFWLLAVAVILTIPMSGFAQGLFLYIVGLTLVNSCVEFAKTYFQRELRFARFSLIEVLRSVLYAVSLFVAIGVYQERLTARHVLVVQLLTMLGVVLLMFGRYMRVSCLVEWQSIRRLARGLVRSSYGYMLGYFLILAVFLRIDVIMLRALSDDYQLATYGSAYRYFGILLIVLNSVHTVFLPLTQRAVARHELQAIYRKLGVILLFVSPLILVAAWISQWMIPWVDGGKYPQAVTAFRILALTAVVSLAASPAVNIVLRYEQFRWLFGAIMACVIVNGAAQWLLIPEWGATGSAVATGIGLVLMNGSIFFRARWLLRHRSLPQLQAPAVAPAAAAA